MLSFRNFFLKLGREVPHSTMDENDDMEQQQKMEEQEKRSEESLELKENEENRAEWSKNERRGDTHPVAASAAAVQRWIWRRSFDDIEPWLQQTRWHIDDD